MNRDFLAWPFFEDRHRDFADRLEVWCAANLPVDRGDVDAACRDLMARLGRDGWLRPTAASGSETLDVRTLCLARETFARHDGLADFAFAMPGLGTGAISLYSTPEQRAWLERSRAGHVIAAFALTEPKSGSDVANMEPKIRLREGVGKAAGFLRILSRAKEWGISR
jgi:acyl-CoA dehydrogenase